MRIAHRYLTFERNDYLLEILQTNQIKINVTEKTYNEDLESYSLEFFLYEDEPNFAYKQNLVQHFTLLHQVTTEFSPEDFDMAEWFWFTVAPIGYPQPEGKFFETTYAIDNVCFKCEIGKRQKNPFRLKAEPKPGKNQFLGLHWVYDEMFVRDVAANIFRHANVTGMRFSNPVVSKSHKPIESIQQLHVDTVLSAGLIPDGLTVEICNKPHNEEEKNNSESSGEVDSPKNYCGQLKYNFPQRGTLTFDKNIFEGQPDFVKPYEWFGSGGSASRPILVSKKVRNIILKEKFRGAFFAPVFLK